MNRFYTLLLSGWLLCLAAGLSAQPGVALSDADGAVGTTVCTELSGTDFVGILGMQFSIIFDDNVLSLESASGSINGTNVSMVNNANQPNVIRVNYAPFTSVGYTDPGPFVIGQICFEVLQDVATNVILADNPTPVEFTDDNQQIFEFGDVTLTNAVINEGSAANCNDGIMNGAETGVDCGGPDCAPCTTLPTCDDGVMNGQETGVDCGGPDCAPCTTAPTCDDGVMNGQETGVDCGGPDCAPCNTGGGGDCGGDSPFINICASDVCDVAVGQQACVDLTVSNFNDVTGVQLNVLYPAANLDFTSFTAHPTVADATQVTEFADGEVRIFIFRGADSPNTIADDETLVTLCYEVENAAATVVDLDDPRLTDQNGAIFGPVANDGSINAAACDGTVETCTDGVQNNGETGVDCGGPNCAPCNTGGGDDCGAGSSQINICAADVCDVAVGQQACVDLTVSNFTGVTGVQLNVLYPAANLDFTSFTAHPTVADATQVTEFADGEVRIFIFRGADSPNTIADNETLLTICYEVENMAATVVDLDDPRLTDQNGAIFGPIANDGSVNAGNCDGDQPTATCFDGIQNGDETGVDCGGTSCMPCQITCGADTDDVQVCVGSMCADAGAEVCLPIFLGNFDNHLGLQFRLVFEAGNLNYSRFMAHPSFSAGTTVGVPADGEVSLIWNDPSLSGVGIGADEPAFEICFIVEVETPTPITFKEPTDETLRAFGITGSRVDVTGNPGAINQGCADAPTCSDGIMNGQETGVDCGGPDCAPCTTMPTCDDGIMNGQETGVDCGGPDCAPCTTTPTCDDGVMNGQETGVDCGGPDCQPCQTNPGGEDCGADTDVWTVCVGEVCDIPVGGQFCVDLFVGNFDDVTGIQLNFLYPAANLDYVSFTSNLDVLDDPIQMSEFADGEVRMVFFDQDQSGTTVADGESIGTICFTNETAGTTIIDADDPRVGTTSGAVLNPVANDGSVNACTTGPSCTNGIKDGDEEGVDCGGSCPDVCPTCEDNVMNGDETGVDCGGSCGPCPDLPQPSFTVADGTAAVGEQVCVAVSIANFTNIGSVSLRVDYDPAVLSFASVMGNPALADLDAADFNTTTAGQIVLNYDPANALTLPDGQTFFTVCFNVLTGAETTVAITNLTVTDDGGTNLMASATNGTVNTGGMPTFDNLTLRATSATGGQGTEVCIDVEVFNLEGLAGLQFAIGFDEDVLEYTSGMSTNELMGLQVANPSPGILRVVWFDPQINANSVDDGNSIVRACFNVLQECETAVTITEQPPQFRIRATDTNNMSVTPIDRVDGTVNAGTGNCGDGPEPPENLVLTLSSRDALVGEEVCLDLTAANFAALSELSFSVTYDATRVSFTNAANFGLSSINAANVTNPTPGVLVFDWTSTAAAGETLPNGARLLSLCFTVDEVAVTPVNFANAPTAIVARNGNNQAVGVVPVGGAINPNAPEVDGLTFQIGSASAAIGDEICLPIIGFDVDDIIAFQYTISYDPTKLEYLGTGPNFGLPGFSASSVVNNQPGILQVLWFDNQAQGNTVPDGTTIYSICFRVLTTDLTLVTFADAPVAIEFELSDGIVEAELLNGQVNGSMAPSIVGASVDPPNCAGGSDGSIVLTVSGGNNLTYTWSPNVSNSNSAVGLSAGLYSVTVSNPAGQTAEETYTITDPGPFALEVASVSGVSCSGEADGAITIATIGNNGPFTFDWSGNLPDGVGRNQQTDLDGGSYSVTVTDRFGCSRILTNITIGEPAELNIVGSEFPISSTGSGGVTIEVDGGRPPFTYAWTGPGNYTSTEEDIDDATVAGTYCLTVTDNNDCTSTQCFGISQMLEVTSIAVSSGCAGEDNAAIDITVAGGTGAYDFAWSTNGTTFANTEDVSNLAAPGEYTVTVTSGDDQVVQTIDVEAPEAIQLSANVTAATNGSNGSITLIPSGGNGSLSFVWDDGPTTQNRTELAPGEYCVTATDGLGCTADACFTVGAAAPTIQSVSLTSPGCFDGDDGTIRLVLSNAVPPLQIRVEPLGLEANADANTAEVMVPAGTHTVFITDAQGVTLDTTVTVTAPEAIAATATVTSDTEDTNCSGMITLAIGGGTAPYTVSWDNGMTGATLTQLCAGDYVPTITDANGCTLTLAAVAVGRIDEELVAATEVACEDGTEGAIDVSITGGVEPYAFVWVRTGSSEVLATTEDLTSATAAGGAVGPGNYTLTVADATGATLVRNYTVGVSAGFSITTAVTSNYNGFDVSCPDAADGRIVVTLSGQGDFMYEFVLDGQMVGIDSVLENAVAGLYTVTVIDEGGCTITREVEVTAPPAITLSTDAANVSCAGANDGSITVEPSGGVGPYRLLWSTGATTSRISALRVGDYAVTVTDANECTTQASFTLTGPEDLAVTLQANDATDGCNGSVRIIPLGGSGNYRYNWPQLPNQGNDPLAEGLCPGDYTVEVTDDNGCQTVIMVATVLDRRFPCLSARDVITPNGDGLNEAFVIFCSDGDEAINNTLQIFNRWGQRVYNVRDYQCSDESRGINCFEGRTNDGSPLPAGAYYYVFDFTNLQGERMQQRGSLTIVRD